MKFNRKDFAMTNLIYHLIFLLLSLYILFKALGYAIYEIKEMHNRTGGIAVITFSVLVVILANIMMSFY